MWTYQHSVSTTVPPALLWACYANADVWPEFDAGLEQVTLEGPFTAGTRGTLLPKEGDPRGHEQLPFVLVRAVRNGGFTAQTEVPGVVVMRFVHTLTALPGGGTRIVHGVEIDGPAADEVGPQAGPGITTIIPDIVSALIRVAADRGGLSA